MVVKFSLMRIFTYFQAAKTESKKSDYRIQIGAVIVKGGRIISRGYNQVRHCSTGKSFSKSEESLHAERDACRRVDKEKLKGATIFVYREYSTGKPALAKPCEKCMELLTSKMINKIYYTTNEHPYYEVIKRNAQK